METIPLPQMNLMSTWLIQARIFFDAGAKIRAQADGR